MSPLGARRILVLRNCRYVDGLVSVINTLNLDNATEVRVDGGLTAMSDDPDDHDWIKDNAEFRPEVVLMVLRDSTEKTNPRCPGADGSGSWFLQRWEAALASCSEFAETPRILLPWSRSVTRFINPDHFFRVLPYDCGDREVLRSLQAALDLVTQRAPNAFISYSSRDKRFVRRLAADLRTRGIVVWLDEAELRVGDSLIESLRSALDEVQYVVAIISQHSVRSQWVKRELDIAMNHEITSRRLVVIPVCRTLVELPGFLQGKVYADFSKPKLYRTSFERLVNRIREHDER